MRITCIHDPNFKVISNKRVNVNGLAGFNTVFQHSEYDTLGDKPMITEYNGFSARASEKSNFF